MKVIVFLLLASFAQSSWAGWIARVLPETDPFSPGRAVIIFSSVRGEGAATFGEAVRELTDNGDVLRLELITLHGFLGHSPQFEQEIVSVLQQAAPVELAEAKRSAGNMHNPKVVALGPSFDRAVLETPTVRALNKKLETFGLRIAKASHEKLMVIGGAEDRRLDCFFVYLTVGKNVAQQPL